MQFCRLRKTEKYRFEGKLRIYIGLGRLLKENRSIQMTMTLPIGTQQIANKNKMKAG